MIVQRIELAGFPRPSLARTLSPNGRAHHMARHRTTEGVHMQVALAARGAGLRPMHGLVTLRVTYVFPQHRKRDDDNYSTGVLKAVRDALVRGGWLEADDAEHVRQERPVFVVERGQRRMVVELEEE